MKECRFCQGEIPDGKLFKITEPDGQETPFCAECARDMIRYLNSGQAERDSTEREVQATNVLSRLDEDFMFKNNPFSSLNKYGRY